MDKDTLEKDIYFGFKMEYKLFKYLKKTKPNVVWLTKNNQYSEMDYSDDNNWVYELKSRRFNKTKYNTHMVENNKINYLNKNPHLKGKIYFMFYDGLYVYNHFKDSKRQGIIKKHGGRCDRGIDETKETTYIKDEYLKLVTSKICCTKPVEKCLID